MADDASRGEWIEAALRRFEAPLLRYAARLLGSEEAARDAVQETFLRLCQADRARVDDHLAQWLYTVCRTRAVDARRKERPVDRLDESNTPAVPGHALAA